MSFETPEYTANSDVLGILRLLEVLRVLKLTEDFIVSTMPWQQDNEPVRHAGNEQT